MLEFICRSLRNIVDQPLNESLPSIRKAIDAAGSSHPAAAKVTFSNAEFSNVPCLVATPKSLPVQEEGAQKLIIYIHGGAYVFGSAKGYKGLLAQLAVNSQATVFAIDYRLAPEHPYPAPQTDCLTAAAEILNRHPTWTKVIAGDSAGGALALSVIFDLHKQGQDFDG